MFGQDVHQLRVLLVTHPDDTMVFQKDGNYGDTWNYGQVTLNVTSEATVSDITQRVHSLVISDQLVDRTLMIPFEGSV